ncbi:JAB domain-containing protein [Thalassotalea aquiviva]|uniref:JAB domain-containing protein n=1 Tax=Thalassotalea aquiviva TaxID=3242415 RepID=UPI00352B53B0
MHSSLAETYKSHRPLHEFRVLEKAAKIIERSYLKGQAFTSSGATQDFLMCKLGTYKQEVFAVMLLDSQHHLIEYKELFFGTIDAATVYPREVVRAVFEANAAAVVFAHNHPSGISEPSIADKNITERLIKALGLIDVRVLDHIIVAETPVSFAEKGLL